ncbi:MAG: type II toxin-antitoxin system VapC family toxin [Acidobacteriaceae bacterium]|nr:type II toxin-antitoxin system VapC family toxin [Acidobacteriaceae bacterium]
MILVDTNVISEPLKPAPDPRVMAWIEAQDVETLFLSAITVAELRFGVAALPPGKRRSIYEDRIEHKVLPVFTGRVLPFDLEATPGYASLMARAKASGRTIHKPDSYIAATAAAHGLIVATRDVTPFEAAGLHVINPWKAQN